MRGEEQRHIWPSFFFGDVIFGQLFTLYQVRRRSHGAKARFVQQVVTLQHRSRILTLAIRRPRAATKSDTTRMRFDDCVIKAFITSLRRLFAKSQGGGSSDSVPHDELVARNRYTELSNKQMLEEELAEVWSDFFARPCLISTSGFP